MAARAAHRPHDRGAPRQARARTRAPPAAARGVHARLGRRRSVRQRGGRRVGAALRASGRSRAGAAAPVARVRAAVPARARARAARRSRRSGRARIRGVVRAVEVARGLRDVAVRSAPRRRSARALDRVQGRTARHRRAGALDVTGALKRRLRGVADQAARVSGWLALCERERALGLTVLTYHRVLPAERCRSYPFPGLALPLDAFRSQLRWLTQHARVLPLGAALQEFALQRAERPAARPLVALTFDDGYAEASACIGPELERADVRGTFFVTTGFVDAGAGELLWFDRAVLLFGALAPVRRRSVVAGICGDPRALELPEPDADARGWTRWLKRRGPLEREALLAELARAVGGEPDADGFRAMRVADVAELRARGHEIGSHTVSHPILPGLSDERLRCELVDSKRALELWLGEPVRGFCHPNGDTDARVGAAVARAGYAHACTTRAGVFGAGGDAFAIPRVDVVPERVSGSGGAFEPTAFRRELCNVYRRRGWADGRSRGESRGRA
ncbi:MAG: hypothetical protein EPO68_02300 [Planctomycetota bacterium]|nr:MAG: hypothetical protein EPO68_02300 [Planctomycetota bacterium]